MPIQHAKGKIKQAAREERTLSEGEVLEEMSSRVWVLGWKNPQEGKRFSVLQENRGPPSDLV